MEVLAIVRVDQPEDLLVLLVQLCASRYVTGRLEQVIHYES
jgi:hypothetical protein